MEFLATIRKFLIVRQDGALTVNRNIDHYNFDAIVARATERLRDYLINGVFCGKGHTVMP